MNKKLVLIILLILGISLFSILGLYIRPAKATWVEGHITTDTTWKIQDSPFIVINELVIDFNATLTIDPGVEVRFGGNFSLTVDGSFSAVGNNNSPILFTSNRIEPSTSDWNEIVFTSSSSNENRSFVMKYCVMKYAVQIFVGKLGYSGLGEVVIEYCQILNCKNGVNIFNWQGKTMNVTDNIIEARDSGIVVWGFIQNAHISRNLLRFCEIGIKVGDYYGGGYVMAEFINSIICNNAIGSCTFGIFITHAHHYDLLIQNNSISSTRHGIFIDGYIHTWLHPGAHISNNTIAYNDYGIFVTVAVDGTLECDICFNNICFNNFGMNVSNNLAYNATHNYWGDFNGPYHVSLNPYGKGNPLNGEGNLIFIPYLTVSSGAINERPNGVLNIDKDNLNVDETITFDASSSTDDGRIDYYYFDFGDGTNSSWIPLSVVVHKYAEEGIYNATLIVMDDFGVTSLDGDLVFVEITVVPEFSTSLLVTLFMIVTLLITLVYRKRNDLDLFS